ncbi:MAG: hypothetical protein K9M10_03180 [Candidatus Pacebacteria bacterium]|nr:hypothetical protein [Candidatus Paceibacterota bacterium]MCF7857457.1 hypothetical protein [Candidatus Paceibacterota bacterium]
MSTHKSLHPVTTTSGMVAEFYMTADVDKKETALRHLLQCSRRSDERWFVYIEARNGSLRRAALAAIVKEPESIDDLWLVCTYSKPEDFDMEIFAAAEQKFAEMFQSQVNNNGEVSVGGLWEMFFKSEHPSLKQRILAHMFPMTA